jgi:hypothetical protein
VTNPIVPTDLERYREAERGRRQMSKLAEADLKLGFVHVKPPQACPHTVVQHFASFLDI